jgi:hypothetical protein
MQGFHYLALFLDPRAHVRVFVQQQSSLLGSNDGLVAYRGNTEAFNAVISTLNVWADVCVSDEQAYVKKQAEAGLLSVLDAKQKLLQGQLRAFVGVHAKLPFKVLGIGEDSIWKCAEGDSPLQWYTETVPVTCELRAVGLRLFSAKPSSTPVERLWNAFGDNLTAKRRSMSSGRLAELVFCRMNMKLVPNDLLQESEAISGHEMNSAQLASVFEAVADIDEQEETHRAALTLRAVGNVEEGGCARAGDRSGCSSDDMPEDEAEIEW